MHIRNIELRHVKLDLITPFETSLGVEKSEEHIIIRVDTENVSGWGESVAEATPFYSYETVGTAWHILEDFLIPGIIGLDIDTVQDAINSWQHIRGHRMAKAGLEAALWDAIAKEQGIPLARLLGGVRQRIDAGVSIGIQPSAGELIRQVENYLDEGYQRIKIKIAPGNDMKFIRAIRQEFPDIVLQVDANSAYSLDDISTFQAMDAMDLLLIEQPLDCDDIYQHSKLQCLLKTPLCLDESIHSLADAQAAVELDSCRIINIKPGRVGGYTEAIKIHDYCTSQNIPVWHGGMLESGIGRAGNIALASLANFSLPGDISASRRYYHDDIIDPPIEIDPDGTITVPDGPGIGVAVNIGKLDYCTLQQKSFKCKGPKH